MSTSTPAAGVTAAVLPTARPGSQPSTIADAPVLFRVDNGVGRITLNRPRQINALDHEMVRLMTPVLYGWATDPGVTAVIIDGAGERGLCAGGDIKAIHADALAGTAHSIDYWRDEYRLDTLIARFPKPVVTLMDGIVMGGGVGIAGHAEHRVVTERSVVGMPEVRIGVIPDVGGTWLLSRSPGGLGLHVGLTAGSMSGADAIAAGFADHYVASADLPDFIDRIVADGVEAGLAAFARRPEPGALERERGWIDRCYAGETVADVLHRLELETASGAQQAAAAIRAASPSSVTVTFRAIRKAAALTLEEAIEVEFALVCHALREPDLAEGIRAQVIDKDRTPRWRPATLAAVGDVDHWFVAPDTEPVFPSPYTPFPPGPTAK